MSILEMKADTAAHPVGPYRLRCEAFIHGSVVFGQKVKPTYW